MVNQEHLRILVSADVKQLNAGLNTASAKLGNFGKKLTSIGKNLTTRVSLPLALAGGAAVKMAVDFDTSMTKIKTLVGVSSQEVDKMRASVIRLGNDAGVSSNEAAEALFFITSAGLRGADALSVLQASTKAAAIGLGETKTVADLATSALNAYGIENLSAIEATDVLTAAVREGKLESTELAGAMGRVLPIASNMGISFNEVGAAFAGMSRTGTNANEAATQLRGILTSLLKPTEQSKDMLASLGLSAEGLRQSLREDGLLATLEILKSRFEGNDLAAQTVFGNVRALTGIMDLLGAGVETTRGIFSRMENTTGTLNNAFVELQKSSSFKLQKSLKTLQNKFSEVGSVILEALLPAFLEILNFVIKLFNAFNKLSPEVKNLSVIIGGLLVVLPPILAVFGTLITVIAAIISPVGLVVAAIALLALHFNEIKNIANDFSITLKTAILNLFVKLSAQVDLFLNRLGHLKAIFNEIITNKFNADLESVNDKFNEQAEAIKKSRDETIAYREEGAKLLKLHNDLPPTFDVITNKVSKFMAGLKTAKTVVEQTGESIKKTFAPAKFEVLPKVIEQTRSWSDVLNTVIQGTAQFNEVNTERVGLQERLNQAMAIGREVSNVLYQSFSALAEGGNFFKPIIQYLKQLVIKLIAAAAAAAILAALLPGGEDKVTKTISYAEKFTTLFKGISGIGEFANGGIVSGPTLGLMGEYSGARANPEVVAPLDKLKGMIGNQAGGNVNVTGEFRLKGQDLVVALQRANKQRNRIL